MSEIRNYLESKKEEMIRFLAEIAAIRSVQGDSSEEHPFGEENAAVLKTTSARLTLTKNRLFLAF